MRKPRLDKEPQKTDVPKRQGSPADDQPIRPLEPTGDVQPETPKVGTTDAPGG